MRPIRRSWKPFKDAKAHGNLGVPLHLRNAVTSLMRDLGYGKGYRYVHDDPQAKRDQSPSSGGAEGSQVLQAKGEIAE